MPRQIGKLTALEVTRAQDKGWYADGGNLYLQVGHNGNKAWVFRYMLNGKAKVMGLGALHAIPLAIARKKAVECRALLTSDQDPLVIRKQAQTKAKADAAKDKTFKECAEAYIEAHKESWRNPKHVQQWKNTLAKYAYPVIGSIAVKEVDLNLILKILEPIWHSKTETGKRLRSRIETVLDWAKVRELRQGENPARWRGHLENLLACPSRIKRVRHHAALPYSEINSFLKEVADEDGLAARALELIIYTATRTSEVIEMKWSEVDFGNRVWTIPATRMKAGREHKVPLSSPALSILEQLKNGQENEHVFLSKKTGRPLSNMAVLALLRRMGFGEVTTHGFRSTFRDWVAEKTNYAREVAEAALAHAIPDKVEAAYRRGDLFEKRQRLMAEWAAFCLQQ